MLQQRPGVDPKVHPGDVAGLVGGKEQDGVADVAGIDERDRHGLEEIERRLAPFAWKCGNHLAGYLDELVADARRTGYLSKKEIG